MPEEGARREPGAGRDARHRRGGETLLDEQLEGGALETLARAGLPPAHPLRLGEEDTPCRYPLLSTARRVVTGRAH